MSNSLSDRETKVLVGYGQGLSGSEIAKRLGVSRMTICRAAASAFKKLGGKLDNGLHSRALVLRAANLGVLDCSQKLSATGNITTTIKAAVVRNLK